MRPSSTSAGSASSFLPCPYCTGRFVFHRVLPRIVGSDAKETSYLCDSCGTELIRPSNRDSAQAA